MFMLEIPEKLDEWLTELAEKMEIPKEKLALQALVEGLEDREDYMIASERSERIEKGLEKTIPFEEILKKYGMDDVNN